MYISIVHVNKLKYFIPESIPYFELSILKFKKSSVIIDFILTYK